MKPVAVFIALVVTLLVVAVGGVVWLVMRAPPPPPPRRTLAEVTADPEVAELGVISQCDGPVQLTARLVNHGSKPYHLVQVIAACGCTVPDIKTPARIEPGGHLEFLVTLDPWGNEGSRKQRVDFVYAEVERAPPFFIDYEVRSPLATRPGAAHRANDPGTVIRISANDAKTFVVTAIEPAVVDDWVRTPTAETHLTVDWEMVDEAAIKEPSHFEFDDEGRWKRGLITVRTDREGCEAVRFRVYNRGSVKAGTGFTPGLPRPPSEVTPKAAGPDVPEPSEPPATEP